MDCAAKRQLAQGIFAAGVSAADPTAAVAQHLGDVDAPALILAVGKAACAMASPAIAAFPGVPALIVTNYENACVVDGATVMAAAHPVPDAAGLAAGQHVIAALKSAQGPVLFLISGGGSALLPAPVPGVSLLDKATVNTTLLGAGMDIRAMNLVRQHLSMLKGGGTLRLAQGPVTALILSDVIGDDLAVIASGPTVAPIGTSSEAISLLKFNDIWKDMPMSFQTHLRRQIAPDALPQARNILIGSNALSVAEMAAAAPGCRVLPPVEGDVTAAAQQICDTAGEGVTVWGGETTVRLRGDGKGGRNQELALRIAVEAKARGWTDWACLQGGSDGRDGPTDAAGGLVDDGTLARIGDVRPYLNNNDSYHALATSGDLLMTGATGTNVADLGVLIR